MLLLIVLNRIIRLVPRELVTRALISCLQEVSSCSELSVLEGRRVVFMSRLARPCLEKLDNKINHFLEINYISSLKDIQKC